MFLRTARNSQQTKKYKQSQVSIYQQTHNPNRDKCECSKYKQDQINTPSQSIYLWIDHSIY